MASRRGSAAGKEVDTKVRLVSLTLNIKDQSGAGNRQRELLLPFTPLINNRF